ncbi:hypothetical protein DXG03_003547 [Asterophora parasitica]|uniref:Phosphatidate phosphatase APP1 catalytic domain-containing protein n=1 Tax=Asterophora parasitica TaxID=117018 RepID=A0A9P7K9E7_9AGAR|nr:hypothetical protein DXG03_003547 [Asterophora parasitica]
MSDKMPSSWRSLASASSRISSFKDYLHQPHSRGIGTRSTTPRAEEDQRRTWREWAGDKIKLTRGISDGPGGTETVNLFPGWAARRYRKIGSLDEAFEVEVFVSGFAISYRSAETASRSQRAFIRLAKGFAALPKITADALEPEEPLLRLTPSTEELLAQKQLPPRPTEITEDYEINELERQFQRASTGRSRGSLRSSSVDSDSTLDEPVAASNPVTALSADALRKLHANLESRLQPFWSSGLSSRTIRLSLYASRADEAQYGPVAAQDVVTAADGSFQANFVVGWEDLCQHPGALHIAFGDHLQEHDLLVAAQLLSPVDQEYPSPEPTTEIHIPITHSPIRVISDIDDTVKLSNVLGGARTVFHNVFVKDLEENIIPGMGEWYSDMWSRGVRFHYVSNGPFALLPVLSEFLQVSRLPLGSIKLKSYAGRSIFNGLLSAPAARKRAGVVEVLDAFPESRFFLIGDTGEQDLELYADLARERPIQILAVFVRDVDTGEPIDDPTGWKALGASGTYGNSFVPAGNNSTDDTPRPRRTLSDLLAKASPVVTPKVLSSRNVQSQGYEYFTPSALSTEPESISPLNTNFDALKLPPAPSSAGTRHIYDSDASVMSKSSVTSVNSQSSKLPEAERRRQALQMRVYVARTQMPGHVPLRVFREASECVEAEEILDRDQVRGEDEPQSTAGSEN